MKRCAAALGGRGATPRGVPIKETRPNPEAGHSQRRRIPQARRPTGLDAEMLTQPVSTRQVLVATTAAGSASGVREDQNHGNHYRGEKRGRHQPTTATPRPESGSPRLLLVK